jgi:tetratricopeptide (TPR) repeat protein
MKEGGGGRDPTSIERAARLEPTHAGDETVARAQSSTAGPALTALDAMSPQQVLEWLCDDQVNRWRRGQRVPAETYLARLRALEHDDSEAAFEMIYGEYLLREELGDSPTLEEFTWRFPDFASRLKRQLELHEVLHDEDAPTQDGGPGPLTPGDVTAHAVEDSAGRWCAPGFRRLGELGRGGMGVVYKAWQLDLKRVVALKVIRSGACVDAQATARFHAEAEAAARFQHPNIVQVFEVGEHEGVGFLVLEFAAGGGLDRKLAGSPLDPQQSARLTETLARAIHYAHQRGIVHRDLKPANVLLTEDGVPKITDFGLAKLLERDHGLTHSGDILGTPSYMAPEQTQSGSQPITPAADVYALGAILYEMLTGRPPFKGTSPISTLEQVRSQEPVSPSRLQRHTPRDLETICLKCLEKEPHRRYTSALVLAEELARFLEGQPIVARPTSTAERAWKWARRRPAAATLVAALAGLVVVLLCGGLYYNARLRAAVHIARGAERDSQASAAAAAEQRNVALEVLNELVDGVQIKLGQTPATRTIRQQLLDTALARLDRIAKSSSGSPADVSQAVAHQKLGDIFRTIGRADDAQKHYERATHLGQELFMVTPRKVAVLDVLYQTHMGLGLLHVTDEKFDEAKREFERAVAMSESIMRAAQPAEGARRQLIEAYLQLGRSHSFAREFAQAEVCFRKMQDLAAAWAAQQAPDHEARDLLASSYRKLGDLKKFALDLAAARNDYLKAITIERELVALEPANADFKAHLSTALDDLAGVAHSQRRYAEARGLFDEAVRIRSELAAADRENVDAQSALLHTEWAMARLDRDEAHYAQAAERLRSVLRRFQALERQGQLEGARSLFESARTLKGEIAVCEAAPRALEDFDFARSQPAPIAAWLLLLYSRVPAHTRDPDQVKKTSEALTHLQAEDPDDLFEMARALVRFSSDLESISCPAMSDRDRKQLRQECAARAAALLGRAVEGGFRDLPRMESSELGSLRQHPAYQAALARRKKSAGTAAPR